MASAYPGALDNFTDGSTRAGNLADAINKMQTEMGVNPSGAFADIATRFASLGGAASAGYGSAFNVRDDFGAAGNGVADDTAEIQAALNAAGVSGGVVFFPAGVYNVSGTLTYTGTTDGNAKGILLQGETYGATKIKWTVDLGANIFGIRSSTIDNRNGIKCQDIWFEGPGSGFTINVPPANMLGLRLSRMTRIYDCNFGQFYAGVSTANRTDGNSQGDHCAIYQTQLISNFYGFYDRGPIARGDWLFQNCDMAGTRFASFAQRGAPATEECNFIGATVYRGHSGFGPYCFFVEDAPAGGPIDGQLVASVAFQNHSFESWGNASLWVDDPDRGTWDDIFLYGGAPGGGQQFDATYKIGARVSTTCMRLWRVRHMKFIQSGFAQAKLSSGGTVWIEVNNADCIHVDRAGWLFDTTNGTANRAFKCNASNDEGNGTGFTWNHHPGGPALHNYASSEGVWIHCQDNNLIGSVMQVVGRQCKSYADANRQVLGVAMTGSHGAAGYIPVATRGIVRTRRSGTIQANEWVKPNTAGQVITHGAAGTAPDDMCIGMAIAAGVTNPSGWPAGDYVDVRLRDLA